MKVELFDFQKDALNNLRAKILAARSHSSTDNPQVISFSAPTGAGKTIVMSALFESILWGEPDFSPQSDAVILWISDIPELNEQTKLKIESMSNRIKTRQLVNIDSNFDEKQLEGGQIYFINTQKLGNDKLLASYGDGRTYTIWETLSNTATEIPDRFYVIIDEAHRGMKSSKASKDSKTIMQKFLLGDASVGLSSMPLVVGVSATPKRFEDLLTATTHTVHKVYIPASEVRESGLLKDRVLINYPDNENIPEMSTLAEATKKWNDMYCAWEIYCEKEEENKVKPILVIQVEDGNDKLLTKTDLDLCMATMETQLGEDFKENEVAHNFNGIGDISINGRTVRYIEASQIQENPNIKVVFFKLSLSTGWDCPRAEVMMSFRRAEDFTYIAQLLGRMVRTPLARRIDVDSNLNDVHLYLPYYNQSGVEAVIEDLNRNEEVPPTETGTNRELVNLERASGFDAVFDSMDDLMTSRLKNARSQSALLRLYNLARALTIDELDEKALERTKNDIVVKMSEEIEKLKVAGIYKEIVEQITTVGMKTVALEYGTENYDLGESYKIQIASADLEEQFNQAGRLLSNGIHKEYWRANKGQKDAINNKLDVIVLTKNHEGMKNLEDYAKNAFDELYMKHTRSFKKMKEQRRNHYHRLRLATSEPQYIPWILPDTIDFRRSKSASKYEKHLFVEKHGDFKADLESWEAEVIKMELEKEEVIAWLRNVDRKTWSLEIPYRDGGNKPLYPDIIIVRKIGEDFVFDILEPHNPSLDDNVAKAIGLAEFASKEWNLFDRIQLIRKRRGPDGIERYYRLNMNNHVIQEKVLAITHKNQLNRLFEEDSTVD